MKRKLTILATPIIAVGHVNAVTGALREFVKQNHRVIFILTEAYKGKLSKYGFEEFIYEVPKSREEKNPGEMIAKMLIDKKILGDFTPLEKLTNILDAQEHQKEDEDFLVFNDAIKMGIEKYHPDFIYVDSIVLHPAIYYSGIPWILNVSVTPNFFVFSNDTSPAWSGLSVNKKENREQIEKFNAERRRFLYSDKLMKVIESLGHERYPENSVIPQSQSFTVYAYPEEINFESVAKLDWFNLNVFNKKPESTIEDLSEVIPKAFVDNTLNGSWSGKWIYLSMGSMGSIDLTLMNRILDALDETKHKIIVSKGPRHEDYDLPSNMYGERFLPQTSILPFIDLVITHGGNNTVTETFAAGVPMLVLPLFADQLDNGLRLEETGYGAQLEPYRFTANEMRETVDRLLNDDALREKMRNASNRIQSQNKHQELVERIESLFNI